jgi:endonuclease/exonuclease/phosphatase family metal-dependent hydrolase
MRVFFLAVVALCGVWSAQGQTVTPVGGDATFDVAAWNIENLTNSDPQMANAVATMQQAQVDLWSIEEITSPAVFSVLLSRLGDSWAGQLSTSQNVYTAFYYRKDVVSIRTAKTILSPDFDFEFAGRPPLLMDIDVTLPDTTTRVTVVSLHMKCCSDLTSLSRREAAAVALKNRLDFLHGSERIIVMGDFNDEVDRSITFGRDSPYKPFVADPNYRFLIQDGNVGTWCGNSSSCRTGSTIDNILISSELETSGTASRQFALVPGSADRYSSLLTELPNFVFSTSDHLPVVASFGLVTPTHVESSPPRVASISAWPIPARGRLTLEVGPAARFDVVDLLGRRMRVPEHRMGGRTELDLSALSPGLYVIRVSDEGRASAFVLPVTR